MKISCSYLYILLKLREILIEWNLNLLFVNKYDVKETCYISDY
jgi:hypothetical protein